MNHNHTTDRFSVSIQTCKHIRTHASWLWCPLSTECRSHCFSPHSHKEAQELNFLIKSDISSLLHIKSFHDPCLTCTSHILEYSKDKHRIFTHGARTLERFTFRKEVVDKFYFSAKKNSFSRDMRTMLVCDCGFSPECMRTKSAIPP